MGTVPPGRTDGRYELPASSAGRFVTDVRCQGSQGACHRDLALPNDSGTQKPYAGEKRKYATFPFPVSQKLNTNRRPDSRPL